MAKDGERTLTGLARRVEVFLDLVIFNELRRIAIAEDTTVSKILTQIVVEHFRERGVPRRASESARQVQRGGAMGARDHAQPHASAGVGSQPAPSGEQPGQRRRRRRRRGGKGPKSDGGGGEGGGPSQV